MFKAGLDSGFEIIPFPSIKFKSLFKLNPIVRNILSLVLLFLMKKEIELKRIFKLVISIHIKL